MRFLQFALSFLFVRNWHTGELELSRARTALFSAGIFLVLLSLFLVSIMQQPVVYDGGMSEASL